MTGERRDRCQFAPTIVICASGNPGTALRDPKLQQSGQTGHGHYPLNSDDTLLAPSVRHLR